MPKIICMLQLTICMLQWSMMYLLNFLVFAQSTILFGIVMSAAAAAPAEAHQRSIVFILCDFCRKSFPNRWAFQRHWTCKTNSYARLQLLFYDFQYFGSPRIVDARQAQTTLSLCRRVSESPSLRVS